MSDIDYIKLSATARHIQETVLNRANDNGLSLSASTVRMVMQTAIDLAFIAHENKNNVPPGSVNKGTPDELQKVRPHNCPYCGVALGHKHLDHCLFSR